jgi:hypothetical protein
MLREALLRRDIKRNVPVARSNNCRTKAVFRKFFFLNDTLPHLQARQQH